MFQCGTSSQVTKYIVCLGVLILMIQWPVLSFFLLFLGFCFLSSFYFFVNFTALDLVWAPQWTMNKYICETEFLKLAPKSKFPLVEEPFLDVFKNVLKLAWVFRIVKCFSKVT